MTVMARTANAGRRNPRAIKGLAILVAFIGVTPIASPATAQFFEAVTLNATPVPLNAQDPAQIKVGALTYLGGLHLTSRNPRFGGFSGMTMSKDGRIVLAVSDRAAWWAGRLYFRNGALTEIDDNSMGPITGPDGQPLVGIQQDAEALTLSPDGVAHVAFERDHRILQFHLADPNDLRSALYAPTRTLPRLEAMRDAPGNGGVEALVALGRNLLLAITEEMPSGAGEDRQGWLIYGDVYLPIAYRPMQGFSPTDATLLPDGDVLMVERRYSPRTGVAARLCIIPRATIAPESVLVCETIAELVPPLTVDNFEGVAARRDEDGETIIYLLSDDNFSSEQRTLFMMFRLDRKQES